VPRRERAVEGAEAVLGRGGGWPAGSCF
jgi:hypothetical protein